MAFKITKLNILGGLELKEPTFINKSFPTHFHDTYSIGIIKEGVENITIEDKNLTVPSKSVVIVNQFEAHSHQQFDNDKWTYLSLYLDIDALHYLSRANGLLAKASYKFENSINDHLLYQQLVAFHKNETHNKEMALKDIVKHLISSYLKSPTTTSKYYANSTNIIEEAKEYFAENYTDKISIDNLAMSYKLNSFQFIRAFKAHTGLTPIAYITLLRLNMAKKLLVINMPIVHVALDCGFYDQSHFTNYFTKFFGVSPIAYRNNFSLQ